MEELDDEYDDDYDQEIVPPNSCISDQCKLRRCRIHCGPDKGCVRFCNLDLGEGHETRRSSRTKRCRTNSCRLYRCHQDCVSDHCHKKCNKKYRAAHYFNLVEDY